MHGIILIILRAQIAHTAEDDHCQPNDKVTDTKVKRVYTPRIRRRLDESCGFKMA